MAPMRKILVVVLVLGSFFEHAKAQGGATGAISGTVEDSSGGVVAGAKVEIVSAATNELLRSESTNASGFFTVTLLPAGAYMVRVSAPGLAETTLRDVVVRVTET